MTIVAIIGVFAAIAVPATDQLFADQRLNASARSLGTAFAYARGETIRTGNIHIVFFERDAAGNLLTVGGSTVDILVLDDGRPGASLQNCAIDGGEPTVGYAIESGVTFGVTEAKRGLFPLGGSSVRLRRQIPYTLAAEILLTARHVTAQEALDFGLVGRVVASGQALAEANKIAAQICDNGPVSIRALMRMLREIDESYSEADALAKELEYGGPVFATKDAREGLRVFKEKRKPVYTGE